MALLPGEEVETATGAIADNWRERQEGKRGRGGDRETKRENEPVFMQTHVHFTEAGDRIPFNHTLPKTESI